MKAAIFNKPGKISLDEIERPDIKKKEVLIKVKATGVCGTDRHILKGEAPSASGIALGHEIAGEIVEVGEEVAGFTNGDRVVVDPNIFCGECFYCQRGEVNLCENLEAIGVTKNGGFAEYVAVPVSNVYKLHPNLSFIEGAMAEPVSCCLWGIERANISPGDCVLIIGGGAIGLIQAQLARVAGATNVLISEPQEYNQELALELGLTDVYSPAEIKEKLKAVSTQGADVVIEAVGSRVTAEETFKMVRKGGTIVLFGVAPQNDTAEVVPFDIYEKELTVKGSYINPFITERALNILGSGRINVKPLITGQYPLEELEKILTEPPKSNAIKTVITF